MEMEREKIITIEENEAELIEQKVEELCRWGAARAGVIVVTPVVGTIALMANEIYMIKRIAAAYDCQFKESNGCAFIGAMSGALAGQTLATLIPFAPMQVAVGIGVTYAIGKAAACWIRDGMPNLDDYKEKYLSVFDQAKEDVKALVPMLKNSVLKDKALGDETKKFGL